MPQRATGRRDVEGGFECGPRAGCRIQQHTAQACGIGEISHHAGPDNGANPCSRQLGDGVAGIFTGHEAALLNFQAEAACKSGELAVLVLVSHHGHAIGHALGPRQGSHQFEARGPDQYHRHRQPTFQIGPIRARRDYGITTFVAQLALYGLHRLLKPQVDGLDGGLCIELGADLTKESCQPRHRHRPDGRA